MNIHMAENFHPSEFITYRLTEHMNIHMAEN